MTKEKKLVFDDRDYIPFTSDSNGHNMKVTSIKIRDYRRSSFTKVFFIIFSVTVLASLFSLLEKIIK